MLVEVSLEHIPMQAQMCFDATTEGVTGRLLTTCPSSHSWSVIPLLRTGAIGYPRNDGRRRRLLSPRRTRLCSRRIPNPPDTRSGALGKRSAPLRRVMHNCSDQEVGQVAQRSPELVVEPLPAGVG